MVHPNLLDQQINNLRTLQQSYDQIAGAAEAYNTGKVELAQNITAKGVTASPTETLPELADKVAAISQDTYLIDGGEMYAKQLFGSLTTPNYWNLYEVMAQLLSDGRLVTYGGILLAEYNKGYDSLALSGAGSGGAYVVSDKDSQGNFIMYTNDTTHTWNEEEDGKGNRWVAYCFADAGHSFDITDTNTSPRSIFIGRNVGKITSLVDGRTAQIVVPDGNILQDFDTKTFAQNWGRTVVLKNLGTITGTPIRDALNTEQIYIQAHSLASTGCLYAFYNSTNKLSCIIANIENISGQVFGLNNYTLSSFSTLIINCETIDAALNNQYHHFPALKNISITASSCIFKFQGTAVQTSDFTLSLQHTSSPGTFEVKYAGAQRATDVVLMKNWNRSLDISPCTNLTEANMYAHILQCLKQDEADCGDGVTITLGATNLAKLTSQESIDLLDLLTNTYGYTFA